MAANDFLQDRFVIRGKCPNCEYQAGGMGIRQTDAMENFHRIIERDATKFIVDDVRIKPPTIIPLAYGDF